METLLRARAWAAAVAAVLLLVAGSYHALRPHPAGPVRAIDEAFYVRIGGIDQYVRITGRDRANPVLLFVHGGPGLSMMGFSKDFERWEKYFTVVQWDQRGTGRTLERSGKARSEPMTLARMIEDGVELAEFLTHHLHGKIVVVGHSWGSLLGVYMVQARPALFSAYVGTGQFGNRRRTYYVSRELLLAKARAAEDFRTVAEIQALGLDAKKQHALVASTWARTYSPPAERKLKARLGRTMLDLAHASVMDIYAIRAGQRFSLKRLSAADTTVDVRSAGLTFAVPFFVIQGDEDSQTPAELARTYFDAIEAPAKAYIPLKGGGHFAVITMSDAFLNALVRRVRPFAVKANTTR